MKQLLSNSFLKISAFIQAALILALAYKFFWPRQIITSDQLKLAPANQIYSKSPGARRKRFNRLFNNTAFKGAPGQNVKIAYWFKLGCGSLCAKLEDEIAGVFIEFGNKVQIAYKYSDRSNPDYYTALGLECAREQYKFFPMYKQIAKYGIKNNTKKKKIKKGKKKIKKATNKGLGQGQGHPAKKGSKMRSNLKKYAQNLGLDEGQFAACLDNGKYKDKSRLDGNDGRFFGIWQNPALIINAKVFKGQGNTGLKTVPDIASIVEKELAKLQ